MSNDKTTLADVQPGGKVRLATVPFDRAHNLLGDAYNAGTHGIGYSQQAMELHDAIIPAQRSPATCKESLQVQPSLDGQGNAWAIKLARESAFAHSNEHAYLPQTREETNSWQPHEWVVAAIQAAFLGPQPAQPSPGGQGDAPSIDYEDLLDQAKDLIHCGCSVNGAFEWLLEQLTDGEAPAAQPAQAVDLGQPDPTLLRFYQVSDFPSLVTALEAHVLQLIDLRKRSVKPWEDTMPPTLLPKWVRENSPVLAKDLLALAEKWQDEAAATWGESPAHAAKQQCFDELHALIDSKAVGNG
ncbi:hypothetical protein [Stenotrophomonas sp. S4]